MEADLTQRAGDELAAASDALFRVRALLRAVEVAIDGADLPRMGDVQSLVATAIEVASQYGERAGELASQCNSQGKGGTA